jgi:mercuric ion transport protein
VKIQLLWFPGCPNVDAARAALREAKTRAGVDAAVEEIDVSAPNAPIDLRNWGSPTILVDGVDVGGQRAADASACRLYDGGRVPSVAGIERTLRAAADRGAPELSPSVAPDCGANRRRFAGAGAVAAAVVASACCLGPAVLAVLGLSGAGLSAALTPWRPVFLALMGVFVLLGLFLAFRRRSADDCGCPVPRTRWAGRWMMVGVAGLALVVAAYPWLLDSDRSGSGDAIQASATARIEIDGITCAACADGIVRELAKVRGVGPVTIDTDRGIATIQYDASSTSAAALAAVISDMHLYEARIVSQ